MIKDNKIYLIWNDTNPSMISTVDMYFFFPSKTKHSVKTQYVSVL